MIECSVGRIPDSIGNMTNMKDISLSYNRLTGSLNISLVNATFEYKCVEQDLFLTPLGI